MVKGGQVALMLPRVLGWVKTIGKHVSIDRLHGEVGKSTNSGNSSSSQSGILGVLFASEQSIRLRNDTSLLVAADPNNPLGGIRTRQKV